MKPTRKILLKDLNSDITCGLCGGYYIDATTLVDCMHSFCRGCILRHFENHKMACPSCNTIYKKKNQSCFRQDLQLQALVYKVVPGLYAKEMQRREDFYRTAGVRASSSCSDDSVLGDMMQDHEEWVHNVSDDSQFLSPDDSISLSLEYYQHHLDCTSTTKSTSSTKPEDTCDNSANANSDKNNGQISCDAKPAADDKEVGDSDGTRDDKQTFDAKTETESAAKEEKAQDRRYLQCPAAVLMTLLQKFLRMKYALSPEHKVDIIYEGEVLPPHFSLIDVAYSFKWQRTKPMRFFYRIFTPMKIRPIKIINTSSTGQKQLQIVPVQPTSEYKPPAETKPPAIDHQNPDIDAQNYRNKERHMAELNLQSKTKLAETEDQNSQTAKYGKTYERNGESHSSKGEKRKHSEEESATSHSGKSEKRKHVEEENVVYDYEEPDKEELKRFAEKRDREWQMQKHMDEEHRVSKKRKKSKHSKSESLHKKRKLHAEISGLSSKEESIKLKVKLTPHNGHKHKHHKSAQNQAERSTELSSKEKLLQMRQVRHKIINTEEKSNQSTSQYQNNNYDDKTEKQKHIADKSSETKGEFTITIAKTSDSQMKSSETQTIISEARPKSSETQMKSSETQTKSSETQTNISQSKISAAKTNDTKVQTSKSFDEKNASEKVDKSKESKSQGPVVSGKTLRSDFSIKTSASKDLCTRQTSVQIERNEIMEMHAQRTFLKTFPSYADKHGKNSEKVAAAKGEGALKRQENERIKTAQNVKLQQHISRLQQQCTIKTKDVQEKEKKTFSGDKPHILNTQYNSGFTVSKIESGVKRKAAPENDPQDKRPSLEITLINPPSTTSSNAVTVSPKQSPTQIKRPPPATIPLERIKKSITLKSGISIIPKMPEKCDNIGALDLSKPHKSAEIVMKAEIKPNGLTSGSNGLKQIATSAGRVVTPDKNVQLSNLQMLSKVASEHPSLNKSLANLQNKPRPQMPSLQTLKIPTPQNSQQKTSNLAKLPKLNEINKSQFRMANNQMRTMRPNQNQSIRSIPNPSLLVRQQNQNRLNSLTSSQNSTDSKDQVKNTPNVAVTKTDSIPNSDKLDDKTNEIKEGETKKGN